MAITYTTAAAEDTEQLYGLFLRYIRELEQYEMDYSLVESGVLSSIQGKIRSRMTLVAVAKDGNDVIGFLFCNISRMSGFTYEGSPLFGYISDTFVLPEYRRYHVAGQLTERAFQWLRENEVGYVQLEVLESNQTAHNFWQKQGFVPTKRIYGKKLK